MKRGRPAYGAARGCVPLLVTLCLWVASGAPAPGPADGTRGRAQRTAAAVTQLPAKHWGRTRSWGEGRVSLDVLLRFFAPPQPAFAAPDEDAQCRRRGARGRAQVSSYCPARSALHSYEIPSPRAPSLA